MLAEVAEAGLTEAQAAALAALLGGGLTASDLHALSLGEVLQTARAAGLTVQAVTAVLAQAGSTTSSDSL